jgi:hypothetical protein
LRSNLVNYSCQSWHRLRVEFTCLLIVDRDANLASLWVDAPWRLKQVVNTS